MRNALPAIPTQPLFGVNVCTCHFSTARDTLLSIAAACDAATVEFLAVNNLVIANDDEAFGTTLNTFDYIFPDGVPIVWTVNKMQKTRRAQRITARELMSALCAGAAEKGIPVYFYGSTENVVQALSAKLNDQIPGLVIAGCERSVFRPLTDREDRDLVDRINSSGAGLLFVGLGCPLQEQFISAHRDSIRAVQLCVGSAFKFLAGHHSIPPLWVQRMGLEWLVRVIQEPRRLWQRYLKTNSKFLWMLLREAVR